MGGKMKLSTKSTHRVKAARRLFRTEFPDDKSPINSTNLRYIGPIGTEEGLFEIKTKHNSYAIVFYGSCITQAADDISMYEGVCPALDDEEEPECKDGPNTDSNQEQ